MKKLIILFFLLIAIQTVDAQKYGYLNKEELYRSIPEYDTVSAQIEKLRNEYVNQLASMQGDLNSKTASLNNENAKISEYLRQTRQEEIKSLDVRIQLFSVKANATA